MVGRTFSVSSRNSTEGSDLIRFDHYLFHKRGTSLFGPSFGGKDLDRSVPLVYHGGA